MTPEPPASNEFIRKSKWRTRTTPGLRTVAALVTFALIVAIGLVIMVLVMVGLDRLDAPGWVVALPWMVPTAGMLAWVLRRPGPAVLSNDDDDSWSGFAIRSVLVGRDTPRAAPLRVIATVLFGAPIVWSFVVLGILELAGAF